MAVQNFFVRLFQKAKQALTQVSVRFPATLLYSFGIGAILIYLSYANNIPSSVQDTLTRIWMTLTLGLPLSAAVTLLTERFIGDGDRKPAFLRRLLPQGVVAVFLVLFGLFLTQGFGSTGGVVVAGRVVGLTLASVLLFIAIPRLLARPGFVGEQIQLFFRVLTTAIFTVVIFGGICGVIFAADRLFELHVDGRIYTDVIIAAWFVFAPLYFLSGVTRPEREVETREYPLFMKILALYIIAPISLAYTVILYFYLVKIVATLTMPVNLVFNLVFWYSVAVLIVLMVLIPLREKSRFADLFSRWMPLVLLPLEIMMMVSLFIRIGAYGITEMRYFGLVGGLWAIGITILLVLRSKAPFRLPAILPATLAAVAIVSVLGPISAFSITKLSQNARFDALLAKYDLISAGKLVVPASGVPTLSKGDVTSLDSIASSMQSSYGLAVLHALPSDEAAAKAELAKIGVTTDYVPAGPGVTTPLFFNFNSDFMTQGSLDISGYGLLVPVSGYLETTGGTPAAPAATGIAVTMDGPNMAIAIYKDGVHLLDIDATAYVKGLLAKYPDNTSGRTPIPASALAYKATVGGVQLELVPRSLSGNYVMQADGTTTIQSVSIDAYLLVKLG